MRPRQLTPGPSHRQGGRARLQQLLKSKAPDSAPGMLKAEMNRVGSLILRSAAGAAVPGGEALTVDRDVFAEAVTQALSTHPRIHRVEGELTTPPELGQDEACLIATGPLTSDALGKWLAKAHWRGPALFLRCDRSDRRCRDDRPRALLSSPTATTRAVRKPYLNCPMDQSEYEAFIDALNVAEKVAPKAFEKEKFFQGCQPIEAIAATGRDSLRYGPMKPVGLTDPRTGRRPYAVIQLRPENLSLTAYNLVGFQTKLKYGEQSRVFRMIPALHQAEFVRLGSIHRNTYVCGPQALGPDLSLRKKPRIYLAGQITGVEGYLESAACGMLAALFIDQRLSGRPHSAPPANTALGALLRHIVGSDAKNYQPANIHFGLFETSLFDGVSGMGRGDARKRMAEQSLANFTHWWQGQDSAKPGLTTLQQTAVGEALSS